MTARPQTKLLILMTALLLAAATLISCAGSRISVKDPGKAGSSASVSSPDKPTEKTSASGSENSAVSFPTTDSETSGQTTPTEPDPTSETESVTTPDVPKTKVSSFSMLTAGDNLLHSGLLKDGEEHKRSGKNEDFYFDFVYEKIKNQVTAADYAIINQESTLLEKRYIGGTKQGYFNKTYGVTFCTPMEDLDSLLRIGFDCIDLANNHILDMGSGGMQWSLDGLNKRNNDDDPSNDVMFFGAYYDEEDRANIRTIEVNGIKVALLGYTYGTNVSTEQAATITGFRFLVPYIDDEKMVEELHKANEIADFTIVFMHWGEEYKFQPNEEQRRLAKLLAENGAGIIIGHHTHTIQPIEYIPDGKGGEVLCAFSLGTLISNMDTDMNMLAGLFTFDITKWSDGSVTAENPLFTPTVFYYNMSYRESKLMYLNELTASMAKSHGIGNYPRNKTPKNTMTVERMHEYLNSTIENRFLPEAYRK